jgi:Fe-S cluster assembly protein SufD
MSALERMLEEFAAQPEPAAAQRAAAAALRAGALPTRHDENWHYADLRTMEGVSSFAPAAAADAAVLPLPAPLPGFTRLVLCNGRLHPASVQALAATTALQRLPRATATETVAVNDTFESSVDGRLGLVAALFAPEPLALRVQGQLALEIIAIGSPGTAARYTDLAIELAPDARLELVERQLDSAAASGAEAAATPFVCGRLRVQVGARAELLHTRLQQAAGTTLLYDTSVFALAEQARYQLRDVTAGAGSARSTMLIRLGGRDAAVRIVALAAARDTQRADAQYTVLHEAPGTRSDVLFRAIASDRARVACSADVQVAANARGARVLQSLRGLIDGKGAEVDLRPRLTINTDEVQAAHGATTGRLDEDLLFYLLSRGLAPGAARSLLKWAFLGEVLGALSPPALRREAEQASAARLSDTPAAELLQ